MATATTDLHLCACTCGGVLTERARQGRLRKYLPGHAPNYAAPLDASSMSTASIIAFWSNVRLAENGQCLLWTGGKAARGYAQFVDPRTHRRYRGHRLAAALVFGPIPAGVQINHHCDVTGHGPLCVNPLHGFRGDQAANLLDAAAKGFMKRKLSAGNVLEIRALRQAGEVSRGTIAERFNISVANVDKITSGRTWLHLIEPNAPPLPTDRPWTRKAACLRGHTFAPENTRILPNGQRRCRACDHLRGSLKRVPTGWASKLTAAIVQTIRVEYAAGSTQQALADRYGVALVTVGRVVRRQTWKHLEDPTAGAVRVPPPARTHCRRGHPLDETNARINRAGYRDCRACQRDWANRRRRSQAKASDA